MRVWQVEHQKYSPKKVWISWNWAKHSRIEQVVFSFQMMNSSVVKTLIKYRRLFEEQNLKYIKQKKEEKW